MSENGATLQVGVSVNLVAPHASACLTVSWQNGLLVPPRGRGGGGGRGSGEDLCWSRKVSVACLTAGHDGMQVD